MLSVVSRLVRQPKRARASSIRGRIGRQTQGAFDTFDSAPAMGLCGIGRANLTTLMRLVPGRRRPSPLGNSRAAAPRTHPQPPLAGAEPASCTLITDAKLNRRPGNSLDTCCSRRRVHSTINWLVGLLCLLKDTTQLRGRPIVTGSGECDPATSNSTKQFISIKPNSARALICGGRLVSPSPPGTGYKQTSERTLNCSAQ